MTDDRALIAILTDQAKDLTSLLSRAPMTTQVISRIDIDADTVLDTEFNDADESTYADGEEHSLRTGIALDVGEIITRERTADEDALYDWLATHLLPLTGTDRTGTDALYEAKVTAVSDDRFDYLIGRSIEAEG